MLFIQLFTSLINAALFNPSELAHNLMLASDTARPQVIETLIQQGVSASILGQSLVALKGLDSEQGTGSRAQKQCLLYLVYRHPNIFSHVMTKVGGNESKALEYILSDNQIRSQHGSLVELIVGASGNLRYKSTISIGILRALYEHGDSVKDFLDKLIAALPKKDAREYVSDITSRLIRSASKHESVLEPIVKDLLDAIKNHNLFKNELYAKHLIECLQINPNSLISNYLLENADLDDFETVMGLDGYASLGVRARIRFENQMALKEEANLRYESDDEEEEEELPVVEVVHQNPVDEHGNVV